MQALVQLQDGHAAAFDGPTVGNLTELVALRRVPVPYPGPGQLLVKVAMSPVNPSDLLFVKGNYGQPRVRGAAAGFEGTGTIVATGGTSVLLGRRVSFLASGSGAWAEYALTDPASCVAVADGLRDDDAAALLVNPLTAVAMIDLAAEAGARAVMLTAAASQLGRMLIGLARERGIVPLAVVRRGTDEAALRALGAPEVLVSTANDFPGRLAAVLRVEKPRILLDAVGDQTSAEIFLAMPPRSRWISYGILSARGPYLPDMRPFVFSDKRIEGFWLSRWLRAATPDARERAVTLAQQHFLDGEWHTPIAARVALDDAMSSLPAALARPGKVLLVPATRSNDKEDRHRR